MVTVYARHSGKCPQSKVRHAGHHRRCKCPLWLRWGKNHKKAARTRSWEIATKAARKLEVELEREALGLEVPKPADHATIDTALELYLADRGKRGIKDSSKAQRLLGRLRDYAYSTSITWGQADTASTIASRLASGLNTAAGTIITASSSGGAITLTSKATGPSTAYSVSVSITDGESSYFSTPSFSAVSNNLSGGQNAGSGPGLIYSYSIPSSGGYAANGDLLSYTDSVMGAWSFSYDYLDRLTTGTPSSGTYNGQHGCWNYDSFGNRTIAAVGSASCGTTATASYSSANRVTWVQTIAPSGFSYSAAGNVTADNLNSYLYDAENRVCAVKDSNQHVTGYLYEAGGERVAKVTMASYGTCPAASSPSSYTVANQYLLGPGGEQVTEMNGSGTWLHSNAFPAGHIAATYDSNGWHYQFADWLGSRRMQSSAGGVAEEWYSSLPFGDALTTTNNPNCTGAIHCYAEDATEHHLTGKERDSESGNDYFGARYYASSMGRFLSPDWSAKVAPVPYAKLGDPQTLNLYAYVGNNPLSRFDKDGHEWKFNGNDKVTSEQLQKSFEAGVKSQGKGAWTAYEAIGKAKGTVNVGFGDLKNDKQFGDTHVTFSNDSKGNLTGVGGSVTFNTSAKAMDITNASDLKVAGSHEFTHVEGGLADPGLHLGGGLNNLAPHGGFAEEGTAFRNQDATAAGLPSTEPLSPNTALSRSVTGTTGQSDSQLKDTLTSWGYNFGKDSQ